METVDLKVIIIGDAGVGKTSLMYRLVRDKFDPAFLTTIGVDFLRKKISVHEQTYQLVLWDTAGAERFMCLNQHSIDHHLVLYLCSLLIIVIVSLT